MNHRILRLVIALLLVVALNADLVGTALGADVVPEIDPQCRRYRPSTGRLYLYYKFQSGTPSNYQSAYNSAAQSWTATATPLFVYYSSTATQVLATVKSDTTTDNLGWAEIQCGGTGYQIFARTVINTWQDARHNGGAGYVATERQQLCGHELGHAIGLGHIDSEYTSTAIMLTYVPNGHYYYRPNWADVALVNQVYPGGYV